MGRRGLDESSGGWMWGHGLDRSGSGEGKWRALVSVAMNLRVP